MRTLASVFFLFWLVAATQAQQPGEMTIVVMDPLAAPLSCKCLPGYGQRDYDKLGAFLQKRLGRKVRVLFDEALADALRAAPGRRADLIIGKQSLVKFDAAECKLAIRPLARLTDKDGRTTLTGLFAVSQNDPAQKMADLAGYKILFGPEDSDEKHAAAVTALKKAGRGGAREDGNPWRRQPGRIGVAGQREEPARRRGHLQLLPPLLEACGTVEKGSLRIVGRTAEVPFVTVFATNSVDAAAEKQIVEALRAVRDDAKLLQALESKSGFDCNVDAPVPSPPKKGAGVGAPGADVKPAPQGKAPQADWPGWRGPGRDGIVPWLPDRLPPQPKVVWKTPTHWNGPVRHCGVRSFAARG